MKKVWTLAIVFTLLVTSLTLYKVVTRTGSGEVAASFTDCGCGACGETETVIKDIEDKNEFDNLKLKLSEKPSASACATMGCSICTEYRLITT